MKKIRLMAMMGLISMLSFGNEVDYSGKMLIERLKVMKMVEELKRKPVSEKTVVVSDVVGADEILRRIAKEKEPLGIKNLMLVLPDARVVIENIVEVSEKVDNFTLVFLDRESNEKLLKNRDLESFIYSGAERIVDKVKNGRYFQVEIKEEDMKDVFPNSLNKNFFENEINVKYVMHIYKEISKDENK